jgi:dTDP-4-dehydrorhamnose reductase
MITDTDELDDRLSDPSAASVAALARLDGDLVVLGVGGKMGPTLARMARRATDAAGVRRRVIGVARFSDPQLPAWLERHGVESVACDLLDPDAVAKLPDAANVVAMTGLKFGTESAPWLAWAVNTVVPVNVMRRYRASRVVAFSTGNVYGLTPVVGGGSAETDPLRPAGEYPVTTLGRERVYEYLSRSQGTPLVLLRLNYACELRYGVLADVARRVGAGEPVDVTMGALNAIWQGDANAAALAAFGLTAVPPRVLNLAGPETLSVRWLAEQFGRLLGKTPVLTGAEAVDAFLSNAQESHRLFGYPRVPVGTLIEWVADWVKGGGATLGKPTHFEVRDGKY